VAVARFAKPNVGVPEREYPRVTYTDLRVTYTNYFKITYAKYISYII
jgi:hypothetical protein